MSTELLTANYARPLNFFGFFPTIGEKMILLLIGTKRSDRNFFFFSSRRRHTISLCDWSSDVCSSDLRHCKLSILGAPVPASELVSQCAIVSGSGAACMRVAGFPARTGAESVAHQASLGAGAAFPSSFRTRTGGIPYPAPGCTASCWSRCRKHYDSPTNSHPGSNTIDWRFTAEDASSTLTPLYPSSRMNRGRE